MSKGVFFINKLMEELGKEFSRNGEWGDSGACGLRKLFSSYERVRV